MGGISLKILSGSSHPALSALVSQRLCYDVGNLDTSRFSNGESFVQIRESVRDQDVFIIQTAAEPVNDLLMELLITINACKTASARRITAVLPCFPYARQDKKDRARAPITAKLVANMIETAGCHHVILYAEIAIVEYIRRNFDVSDLVIVSPDVGGAKRAAAVADKLQVDLALIHKERKVANEVSRMIFVGRVEGKRAILVDDIADTCGTLAKAAKLVIENGATSCLAIVTHGFLSGEAIQVVGKSYLTKLIVANTLPLSNEAKACPKIDTIDISPVLAEAIRRTHNGESISQLFA